MRIPSRLFSHFRRLLKALRRDETILINQGRILARLNTDISSRSLIDYEFKVFSQFGEDGIIQFLTQNIDIESKTFIEFGIENFDEANCRFLMMKDLWRGFVIDGSAKNIDSLKNSYYFWQYQLEATCGFVDRQSIGPLLEKSGFGFSPGILSIDIDGVDFHIYRELNEWRPEILIVEYNGIFGSENCVTVPYSADFVRSKAHWSNLYWGASLPAYTQLANERGMALVGVTSTGQNAFFVRRELLNDKVREVAVNKCFRDMCFRDSRDETGRLNFLSGSMRRKTIAHLPLVNTVSGETLSVADLPPEHDKY